MTLMHNFTSDTGLSDLTQEHHEVAKEALSGATRAL